MIELTIEECTFILSGFRELGVHGIHPSEILFDKIFRELTDKTGATKPKQDNLIP